jgi:hypothetical protein
MSKQKGRLRAALRTIRLSQLRGRIGMREVLHGHTDPVGEGSMEARCALVNTSGMSKTWTAYGLWL